MKNGEKSDFWGHFWEGSVDFGPNFYLCNTNIGILSPRHAPEGAICDCLTNVQPGKIGSKVSHPPKNGPKSHLFTVYHLWVIFSKSYMLENGQKSQITSC